MFLLFVLADSRISIFYKILITRTLLKHIGDVLRRSQGVFMSTLEVLSINSMHLLFTSFHSRLSILRLYGLLKHHQNIKVQLTNMKC